MPGRMRQNVAMQAILRSKAQETERQDKQVNMFYNNLKLEKQTNYNNLKKLMYQISSNFFLKRNKYFKFLSKLL